MPIPRQLGYIGLGIQAAQGAPVAPEFWVKFAEATSLTPEVEVEQFNRLGSMYGPADTFKMRHNTHGNLTVHAWPQILGALMYLWFGAEAFSPFDDPESDDPAEHIFTPGDALPHATLERAISDELFERLTDVTANTLTLSGTEGEPIKVGLDFVAGASKSIDDPSRSPVFEEEPVMPFIYWMGTMTLTFIDSEDQSVLGDVSTDVTSFELTLNNNLPDIYGMNLTRAAFPIVRRTGELACSIRARDADLYKAVHYLAGGADEGDIAHLLVRGSLDLTMSYIPQGEAADQVKSFQVEIPRITLTSAPLEHDPEATDPHEYEIAGHLEDLPSTVENGDPFVRVTLENCNETAYTPT